MVQQLIQLMKKVKINGNNSQKTIQLPINTTHLNITSSKQNINSQTASQRTVASQPYISRKTNRYEVMRVNYKKQRQIQLVQSLNILLTRRKSYCFQMLKLIFLFPDDTFSENISVNSYDRLFFHDEHIHTIVKIYQTKQLEAKIWAFLNLKDLHKRRKLQKFTIKIQKVERNYQKRTKKVAFNMLQQYSISIKPQPKIKIQKLQPINTKIQRSTIINNQTLKTQRFQRIQRTQKIQRNNIYHRSSNQVIRVGESSSIVKRVQLSPGNGMKIIYPSTIRNQYERNTGVRSVPHRIVQNRQYYNQDLNKSRVIKIQSKNIQSPRQTIYSTETVKNIGSAKIIPYHTFHPTTPATSYQVRPQPKIQPHYNDYGYLVHTVHGDCTINIYNGFQPQQKQRNKHIIPIRDNYRSSHQRYQPAVQYQIMHKCCPCSHLTQKINFHQCHGCTDCFNTRHHSNSQQGLNQFNHSHVYDMENRIQYFKGLEQLNNKVFYHKHNGHKD